MAHWNNNYININEFGTKPIKEESDQNFDNSTNERYFSSYFNHNFLGLAIEKQQLSEANKILAAKNENLKNQGRLDAIKFANLSKKYEELALQFDKQTQLNQKLKEMFLRRQENNNYLNDVVDKLEGENTLLITRISLLDKLLKENEDSLKQYQEYELSLRKTVASTRSLLTISDNSKLILEQKSRKLMDTIKDLQGEYQLVQSQNEFVNHRMDCNESDVAANQTSDHTEQTSHLQNDDLLQENLSCDLEWDHYDFLNALYGFGVISTNNLESLLVAAQNDEQQNEVPSLKQQTSVVSKVFTCDICGAVILTKNVLRQHMNTHILISSHICKLCDKKFPSPKSFNAIRNYQHNCYLCNRRNEHIINKHI